MFLVCFTDLKFAPAHDQQAGELQIQHTRTRSRTMRVTEAVKARHATRAFLDRPVPQALLRQLLTTASRAPSGGNLQPWHVYALTGEALAKLKTVVTDKLARGERETGDYVIYPPNLWEPLRGRRREAGEQRYGALGIGREMDGQ